MDLALNVFTVKNKAACIFLFVFSMVTLLLNIKNLQLYFKYHSTKSHKVSHISLSTISFSHFCDILYGREEENKNYHCSPDSINRMKLTVTSYFCSFPIESEGNASYVYQKTENINYNIST